MNPESLATEEGLDFWREREMLIIELTESQGWHALVELANHEIDAKKHRLLGGQIDTHEGYVKLAAEIRGAEFVLSLPDQVGAITQQYRRLIAEVSGADRGP